MLAVYTLLLLWGLATPGLGLLETVGTLARIDKDELGKGEPEAGGQAGRGLNCLHRRHVRAGLNAELTV